MSLGVYTAIFVSNLGLTLTNVFGNYTSSLVLISYFLSTFFLLFSADEHPWPTPEQESKIKNSTVEIDFKVHALESVYRDKKRNWLIYTNIAIFISSALLYFINSWANIVSSSVVVFFSWFVLIISIYMQMRYLCRDQLVGQIFNYTIYILQIDIPRERRELARKFIDSMLTNNVSRKNIVANELLASGLMRSNIEELELTIMDYLQRDISSVQSKEVRSLRDD